MFVYMYKCGLEPQLLSFFVCNSLEAASGGHYDQRCCTAEEATMTTRASKATVTRIVSTTIVSRVCGVPTLSPIQSCRSFGEILSLTFGFEPMVEWLKKPRKPRSICRDIISKVFYCAERLSIRNLCLHCVSRSTVKPAVTFGLIECTTIATIC